VNRNTKAHTSVTIPRHKGCAVFLAEERRQNRFAIMILLDDCVNVGQASGIVTTVIQSQTLHAQEPASNKSASHHEDLHQVHLGQAMI
jgi:hypothetical protein